MTGGSMQPLRASRPRRVPPPGSLILSAYGLTITNRMCYSDGLIIGRVADELTGDALIYRIGDVVHLRPVQQDAGCAPC